VSKPFSSFQTWKDSTLLSHKALEGTDDIGAILTYSTSHNEKILLKMGLSYVNAKQAEINLEKEIPDWNFARIRNQAQKIWNKKLNKIKVQGGTRKDKVKFYTALYHAMLGPYTASDVNGKYKGMDNKIHTAKDRNHYHFYSLWDTFRSLHPLLNLIEPEQQSDMVASLLAKQEHGGWLPKWEFANRYTNCMIADHATSVISESILKGVDDFNVEKAYQAMKKNALRMPRDGKIAVLSNGNFTPLQIGEKQAHVIGPTDTLSFDWKWKYNDNNFHHYLLKYQKDQNISVYIDQKKIATSQKFSGKIFSKQNLVLGINPDSIEANKYFTGKLDEIAIYPKALDQKQIQQLSQGQQIKNMNSIYRSNCNSLQELSALNIKGSPKFTRGRFQKAVVLDGIDDRIKIETKSIDSSFTISFWFKTSLPSDFMGRAGLDHYIEKGYIPSDVDWRGWGSVSTTLENAYNDYALAKVANKLGKQEDYQYFQQRAQNYGNLFDTTTGFMRPKKSNGGWEKPFDPRSWKEFTEGNAWSYTWFVPHHVKGLIGLMGKNLFIQRLDTIFSKFTYPEWHEEFIHYWHGNEPSQQVPYLYNYVGQSWKTQRVVRKIMDELYSTRRNGIPGNEDVGQLSAWFALSAMGFHPVAPAKSTYLLGSPLFDKVVIDLDKDYYSGSKFTITTENNSKQNKYIQSIQIDNKEIEETWFKHSVIQKGGTIKLKMGSRPNKKQ
jgi:putative alpha-1,2-mannosidase